MKIKSIRLKNFLCYCGETTQIQFQEGLNLILGENGYGKSKLYDAFYWAIRNTISGEGLGSGIQPTKSVKKGLISEKALKEALPGDKVECCVVLEVEESTSSPVSYQIIRSYEVTKQDDGTFQEPADSKLVLMRKDVLHFKPISDADVPDKMARLFPPDILPYMWFQGERGVDQLVDVSKPDTLKTVINRLSDVSRWDRYIEVAEDAFERVEKEFNAAVKSIRRDSSRFDELQEIISRKRDAIRKREDDLKQAQIKNAASKDRIDSVFGRHENAYELKGLKKELAAKENELRSVVTELDNLEISRPRKEFTEGWILEGTGDLFAAFEHKYKEYSELLVQRRLVAEMAKKESERQQTRLPKGIPDRVHIQSMLEKEHCLVCDRDAKAGTPAYEAIRSLLPELQQAITKDTSIEPELGRLLNACRMQLERAGGAAEGRKKLLEKRLQLQQEKIRIEDEISNLQNRIDSHIGVGEDPNDVIATYNNARQDFEITTSQMSQYNADLEILRKELLQAESELRSLSKGAIDAKKEAKKDHFELLRDAAQRLKVSQYNKLIDQLEAEANLHYKKMNEGTGAVFGQIKFYRKSTEGIIPTITDDEGNRMDNVNTSQTTSMKLAIIMAIITANKQRDHANHYPLISDAPISDFGLVKSRAFLLDAAETFNQSIIILKDFLDEDPERPRRFTPRMSELTTIKEGVQALGKRMTVHQLDLPDGLDTGNRKTLSVRIKPVSV